MTKTSIRTLLAFHGQWRSYQKRVLDASERYLEDKRIHIVAAPGSGKTTLGIELIRRLNAPALILSPSINIRNQWLDRIREAYLPEGTDTEGILSNHMKQPALITAITYQALHSCIARLNGDGDQEDAGKDGEPAAGAEAVIEDYRSFDFFAAVKQRGIRTLCLDEAHHLRSEWWKALEELVKREPEMTVISLTATPPYDSTKTEWDRYISLCGPIDEEIIVPELVKEGSLCPHQDYVYFNMPTREEEEAVRRFRQEAQAVGQQILANQEFAVMVSKHAGIRDPRTHAEQLLDDPEYLSAILVFLHAKKLPFSKELVRMLGAKGRIPEMNLRWLELLLQGFLYDDVDSYPSDTVFREQLTAILKERGLIQKNKVALTVNENINKLLRTSKGKIKSIVRIVGEEYKNLGQELRLLILTDYIKKEYMSALGAPEKAVNELGVVPIFENIRRAYEKTYVSGTEQASDGLKSTGSDRIDGDNGLRLAALSGSIVLIPASACPALERILEERGAQASVRDCGAPGYYQVTVSGTQETASGLVTELFNRGEIRVLVGTKSLLGEGWDSPCINSLILASFVGSYMLSNQMRGRAIRTMKGNPDKVSNIWHLICMEPPGLSADGKAREPEESEDFVTLKRRFEGFLGVNYQEDIIENGLERLSFIQPPYDQRHIDEINDQMLSMAADRPALRKCWEDSLVVLDKMDMAVEAGADREYFRPGVLFFNALTLTVVSGVFALLNLFGFLGSMVADILHGEEASSLLLTLSMAVEAFFLFLCGKGLLRVFSLATPLRCLRSIGKGVLKALQAIGSVSSDKVAVDVEEGDGILCFVSLKGGTEREKDVFAQCICEMFGIVENQRYLLKARGRVPKLCRYYCVPELFGKKKEDAQLFVDCIKRDIGAYELCYTRSPQGRQVLLEARIHAFANKNERCVDKKKRVKSVWQ